LSSPTCLCYPVPVVRSQMSCPRCPVLIRLSCPGCPVLAVLLFQLPCRGHFGHCSPDTTVISWQSCYVSLPFPGSPVQAACLADLLRLSCPGCPVPAVLSEWSFPSCPPRVVLSQMSNPDVLFQLAQLFHPRCPVLAECPVPYTLS
jgi:hypothetical protein